MKKIVLIISIIIATSTIFAATITVKEDGTADYSQINLAVTNSNDGEYKMEIYNIKGQKVRTILDAFLARGIHSFAWNGRDSNNRLVGSGNYLVKLSQAGKTISTHQVTMLK